MRTGAHIAGAYALAAQADPTITPARFMELAFQTGRSWRRTGCGRYGA
ncbi:MAG: hypothetical protein JW748_12480 [Anaerolineales bacterium]|nr:hypothetical protein [Anaerolineales bacterium]